MFTNLLPDDEDYLVFFSDYAERHYLKGFSKKYKGNQVVQDNFPQFWAKLD